MAEQVSAQISNPSSIKGRRRKKRHTPLEYTKKRWFQLLMLANFIFLYFPIIALMAFSFNDSRRNITWQGFTFKYYIKAYYNESLFEAFINSLIVAGISTVVNDCSCAGGIELKCHTPSSSCHLYMSPATAEVAANRQIEQSSTRRAKSRIIRSHRKKSA